MANSTTPFGAVNFKALRSGDNHPATRQAVALATYATALFPGDLIILNSSNVESAVNGSTGIEGVIAAIRDGTAGTVGKPLSYGPASTRRIIDYWLAEDFQWAMRANADGAVAVGTTYDLDTSTAGSTTYGRSGHQIDQSDTTGGTLKVVDIPDNAYELKIPYGFPNAAGASNICIVEMTAA